MWCIANFITEIPWPKKHRYWKIGSVSIHALGISASVLADDTLIISCLQDDSADQLASRPGSTHFSSYLSFLHMVLANDCVSSALLVNDMVCAIAIDCLVSLCQLLLRDRLYLPLIGCCGKNLSKPKQRCHADLNWDNYYLDSHHLDNHFSACQYTQPLTKVAGMSYAEKVFMQVGGLCVLSVC